MKLEEHKEQVAILNEIELELITLIADTQNEELFNKFQQWQDQRRLCNKGFISYVNSLQND